MKILVYVLILFSAGLASAKSVQVSCDFSPRSNLVNGFTAEGLLQVNEKNQIQGDMLVALYPTPRSKDTPEPARTRVSLRGELTEIPAGALYSTAVDLLELSGESDILGGHGQFLLVLKGPQDLSSKLVIKTDRNYRANCQYTSNSSAE